MQKHSIDVDHATVNRWVIKFSPLIAAKAEAKKRRTAISWRMPYRAIAAQCPAG
jgi:putative transposase